MNNRNSHPPAPKLPAVLRTAVIFAWTAMATVVLGGIVIIISFFSNTGNIPHMIARIWARSILFVSGVRVRVYNGSYIKPTDSFIFMANHQSNYDIPVLLGYLPGQFRWLAKAELFKIPIFGRSMRGCGYISIDRFNRQSAIDSLNKAADRIKNGASVVIFPEGTRSPDGGIMAFKKGGFVLAIDAGVPIIPVVIDGTRGIMPKKRMLIKPNRVLLKVLPAVETMAYTRENKEELMNVIREKMCDAFSAIQGEHACR